MRRSILFAAVSLALWMFVASPSTVSACERCRFKLDCVSDPECTLVLHCLPTSYPVQGFPECWTTPSSCHTAGALCQWVNNVEAGPEEFLAALSGVSPASEPAAEQCSEPVLF